MTRRLLSLLRRHGAILLLLAAAAALYRPTLSSFGMLMWDEAEYAALSRSVLRGDGFEIGGEANALRPPLLPLVGAASMWLRGTADDAAAKHATVALALVGLAVVYLIGAAAYDRATGLFAAFLLATTPEFWTMTAQFLSETPFLALFAAAVLGFDLGLRRDPRWFWISWIAWALALSTRYTATLFAPFVAVRLGIAFFVEDERRRVRTPAFALAPAVALLLLAPWLVRQHLAFGDALLGFRQASQQLQVYMPGVSMPWNFYLMRLPEMLSPATTALFALGVGVALWRRDGLGRTAAAVVVGLLVWFSAYRYKEVRLVTAILPFVAIVAAAGAMQLLTGRWRLLAIGVAAAILAWNFTLVRPVFETRVTLGYPPFLEALEFLREHASPAAVVMGASGPQIAWYADRDVVDFPAVEDFWSALPRCEWVVFTSFERGQKPYAAGMAKQLLSINAPDDVVLFRNRSYAVLVARTAAVEQHLHRRE